MQKKIAVYPGTFDPITLGHLYVIEKSAMIFDEVVVGVLKNPQKKPMFSGDKRLAMIKESVKDARLTNVRALTFCGLTVEFVRQEKAIAIIRGLRLTTEYEAELNINLNNRILGDEILTVCILPSLKHIYIHSSVVRELLIFSKRNPKKYKKDLKNYVPKAVLKCL